MKNLIHSAQFRIIEASFVKKNLAISLAFIFSQQVFAQAPTITSFTPASAAMGTTVTITGTNFTGATAVSFGLVTATSFNVVSATQITAVVPLAASGAVTVTTPVQAASKTGFYYLPLSGIITDFAGYWATTTVSNNSVLPDNSHNLLAFTYNGITYSTGVNNSTLTGQGIDYVAGNFKALPVSNIAGYNTASSTYLAAASKVDGNASVANASALAGITIKDAMTDGVNGLNLGTGITNLPASAVMTFAISIIHPEKIQDAQPDIIITQIADPSAGNDIFQFVNSAGVTIGNSVTQDMTLLTKLGTYSLDLFNLSPGAPFNSTVCYSANAISTTREIRLVGFKLSDFGITAANYSQVASLKIIPSGTSDYAFVAYSDALEMSPNIAQNIDRTNNVICTGGTANLEVITSAAYGGTLSYAWQESTNGGSTWTTVVNGGNYSGATTKRLSIVSAANNNKYRATVTESGTGYSATSSPFTITVGTSTAPTAVSVSATTTTCLNNLVSLSGSVTGGANLFYQWETNASGSYVSVPDAILKTYLPPVSATGAISYRLKVSGGSGCSGTLTSSPVVVTVAGISSITPASRCGTGLVSLSAAATSGTISWYGASTGGTALATGATYAPTISATTTYYVATDATTCSSAARVAVTATINTVIWAGTNTTDWSTLANWDCGGSAPSALPTASNSVTIPTTPSGGRFPTINVTAPVNNITISPGASITVASGGVFEIYGAIANNGTFTATAGSISMRGSAQQIIPANAFSTNTIKNLIVNNTAGVLLGGALNLTGTLTPTAGVLTTFGYLTLKSDATATARVAAGTSNYIFGNVNVERYVPARRSWRLMTAPLTNSNTIYESWQNNGVYASGKGMLVTAPLKGTGVDSVGKSSLKTWNTTRQVFTAVSNTQVPVSAQNNGAADNTGYFVFIRGDRRTMNIDPNLVRKNTTTLVSTGYLQTGTQKFTDISKVAGGFSLIGNPYASPVDLNLILANSGTSNIKRKFYVWDPQLGTVGGYVVLDDVITAGTFMPTPATSTQRNYIQSGQAFFVLTNTAGTGSVEIKESSKTGTNNTAIFGRPDASTASLTTNLFIVNPDSSIITADGARADFNNAFSAGIDDDDNFKYNNINETLGFLRDNQFLATERRPAITDKDTLFYRLNNASNAGYRFQFIPSGFVNPPLTAILEDSYTGTTTRLSLTDTTTVNFTIGGASAKPDRFRVIFKRELLLPASFSYIRAYGMDDSINVEWKMENDQHVHHYEIERSADGIVFTKIESVSSKNNEHAANTYAATGHRIQSGNNFYRIKSIEKNGDTKYSGVAMVSSRLNDPAICVYPNPVADKTMHVQFGNQPAGPYVIKLLNTSGQLLMKTALNHAGGSDTKNISLPDAAAAGNYQLLIEGKDAKTTVIKLLVQ